MRATVLCSTLGLTLLLPACSSVGPSASQPLALVEVQLLALNDFHGSLEPGTSGAGGAARLATLVKQRAAGHQHSMVVAAGDLVGASPLLSSSFHDEPSIDALTALGLELSSVGNHEFDEGLAELQRLQNGGCHPQGGCTGPARFAGAGFQYLAANVIDTNSGQPIFPGHAIRSFDGIRVGFIGVTLEDTPSLLIPSYRQGLRFLDEAATIRHEAGLLMDEGVEAIIVLIHEGGTTTSEGCASLSGAITSIMRDLHAEVDVVISGHTHRAYNCEVGRRLLTSAGQYGSQLTDITLTLDRQTHDVVGARAETLAVTDALEEDAEVGSIVASYKALAGPLLQRHVGTVTAPLTRARTAAGEFTMGSVVADAMLAAAERSTGEILDFALMNPGGVRNDIAVAGPVTYSDIFSVQPFGNTLTVLTMTGADVEAILRQQFSNAPRRILQVSRGFQYQWQDGTAPGVVPGSIRINGETLQPEKRYRVVTNNFLAEGGDGFTAFAAGTNATPAGADIDALEAWIGAVAQFTPPDLGRILLDTTP